MTKIQSPKPLIIMLRGLPGSGKTTESTKMLFEWEKLKRVSKSDLRIMLNAGTYSPANEKFVIEMRNAIIEKAVEEGFSVVVDDTNFNPIHRDNIRSLAKRLSCEFMIIDIETPLETCILRDAAKTMPVGEAVIRSMYEKYLAQEDHEN